ncbi:MAG: hypothetical protein AAFR04_03325 [Pseudomonadota bacterium]
MKQESEDGQARSDGGDGATNANAASSPKAGTTATGSTSAPSASAPEPTRTADGFTPGQIRALEIACIGMGAILLVGIVVVIGRIAYLATRTPPPVGTPAASVPKPSTTPIAAQPKALPSNASAGLLPAGARVQHVALSGGRAAISYTRPDGGLWLAVIDLETSKVVSDLRLVAAPKR